ncbi:RNAse P, Rpr2/Rpp21 subunit, partial [Piptocephalis cylindrospora]
NLELYQRLNFLHQASTLLTLAGPHFAPLSRSLGRDMDSVRKRSTLRADPSVKRQYCRACHTHLIEGFTLRTRLTRKGGKAIIRTCMYCEKERRLLCNPQHEVFNWK